MVQALSSDELGLAIQEIKTKFLDFEVEEQEVAEVLQASVPVTTASPVTVKPALVCQVCGGKAEIKEGISKAGNEYKVFRCLTNPELTDKGGHSHFQR